MEFVSCKCIEHEVVLDHFNKIRNCSHTNRMNGGRTILYDDYHGDTSQLADFFKRKQIYRDSFRNGTCPQSCKECIHLVNANWNNENYIDYILLTPWVECNSNCIYCPVQNDYNVKANTQAYNYYETVKYMFEHNFFTKDTVFDFAGGEPTMYEKLSDIIALIEKYGYKNIVIHTNGINYSPAIARLISQGRCNVVTSIDSGNADLFYKIKRVDKFDDVCQTLKKYVKAQTTKQNAMKSKYIIIPGINDEEENVLEWINLSTNLGITSVILNLDFNFLIHNNDLIQKQKDMPRSKDNTTLKVYDLINFVQNETSKRNLKLSLYGEICTLKTLVEGHGSLNIIDD